MSSLTPHSFSLPNYKLLFAPFIYSLTPSSSNIPPAPAAFTFIPSLSIQPSLRAPPALFPPSFPTCRAEAAITRPLSLSPYLALARWALLASTLLFSRSPPLPPPALPPLTLTLATCARLFTLCPLSSRWRLRRRPPPRAVRARRARLPRAHGRVRLRQPLPPPPPRPSRQAPHRVVRAHRAPPPRRHPGH